MRRRESAQVRDPPWLWKPGQTSPQGISVAPQKMTCVLQKGNENIDHRGSKISFRRSTGEHPSSKCKSLLVGGRRGGPVGDGQFPTLDPESKSAEIPNSLCAWGGGGGGGRVGDGPSNFCWVQICSNPKFPMHTGGGGRGVENTNFQPVSVLTSCESLGCTTEKWHKNLQSKIWVSASQIVSKGN